MANPAPQQRATDLPDQAVEDTLAEDGPVALDLADLIADENGEVVLFNDSGLRSLAIGTAVTVVAEGRAGTHVTATGESVTGFRFLEFDNGLKLFHPPDLDLILVREPAPPEKEGSGGEP